MKDLFFKQEKGYILVTALLVLIMVAGLALALFREAVTEILIQDNIKGKRRALYLAEGGQDFAKAKLYEDFAWAPEYYRHQLEEGEEFILSLQALPKGVRVISRADSLGKKERIEAEYDFRVNRKPFKYSLLAGGRLEVSSSTDMYLEACFANKDIFLEGQENLIKITSPQGLWAGGGIFLKGLREIPPFWPQQKELILPKVDWQGLKDLAKEEGTLVSGDNGTEVFDLDTGKLYYIEGDLCREASTEIFRGQGIVAIEGDLLIKDSFLASGEDNFLYLVVKGKIKIDNENVGGDFRGLVYGEKEIEINYLHSFSGNIISGSKDALMSLNNVVYLEGKIWEDELVYLEKVFLPNQIELTSWFEG